MATRSTAGAHALRSSSSRAFALTTLVVLFGAAIACATGGVGDGSTGGDNGGDNGGDDGGGAAGTTNAGSGGHGASGGSAAHGGSGGNAGSAGAGGSGGNAGAGGSAGAGGTAGAGGSGGSAGSGDGGGGSGGSGGSGGMCTPTPPSNTCGLAPQCGCAANQSCIVTNKNSGTDGAVSCAPAGTGVIGAACASTADCAAGSDCIFGACHQYCTPATGCTTPAGSACIQDTDTNNKNIKNLIACTVPCDLITNAGCGGLGQTKTTCNIADATHSDCEQGSASTSSCSAASPWCAPGYNCVNGNTCAKWCSQNNTACPGNTTCQPLYINNNTPIVINNVQYGACL